MTILTVQGQVKKPRQRKERREGHDSLSQLSSDSLTANTSRRSLDDPSVASGVKLPDLSATESKEMGMSATRPTPTLFFLFLPSRCIKGGLDLCRFY